MSDTLFDKLSKVIDDYIEEKIDSKIKNNKEPKKQIKDFIKTKVLKLSSKILNESPFEDVFGNKCIISDVTKDHVYPLGEGGTNLKSNIIHVCRISNESKGKNWEGIIKNTNFKITEDKNKKLKSGKVGILSVKLEGDNRFKSISTKKENKRFEEFKENN